MPEAIDSKSFNLEVLTGNNVCEVITEVNPELATIIRENHLAKGFKFFKVNYPYGEKIIQNKKVFLPLIGGGSISMNDPALPDSLSKYLSYSVGVENPVGMILNKEADFYTTAEKRIVSYVLIKPGQLFGFAHIIDAVMNKNPKKAKTAKVSTWNLDAGAKVAFILPKISENGSHNKLLKAYEIDVAKPEEYMEHNAVFRALNANANPSWQQSILYFPKQFLQKLVTDPKYHRVFEEMSGIHRMGYNIWHSNYAKWDSDINYVLQKAKINDFSAYVVSIVKHIYLIIAGGVPGFVPATDESMIPKELIEKAYIDGYSIKDYGPTTMQPMQFSGEETVYYSLNLPTLLCYNPETFTDKTTITLLYDVMVAISKTQKYILNEFKDREEILYETPDFVIF